MTERLEHLMRCSLFESVPPEQFAQIAEVSFMRTLPRGTLVYAPHDLPDGVLLLASGRIEVHTLTRDGKRAILDFIEPGEVFGELAILGGATREEYAEAYEAAAAVSMPVDAFRELMAANSRVSLAFTELIAIRRRRLERRLKSILFHSTRERLIHALLELAEHYGQTISRGEDLGIRLSHQPLADLIGSTRESVTLILGELQAEKRLHVGRKRIVLTNREALAHGVNLPPSGLVHALDPANAG